MTKEELNNWINNQGYKVKTRLNQAIGNCGACYVHPVITSFEKLNGFEYASGWGILVIVSIKDSQNREATSYGRMFHEVPSAEDLMQFEQDMIMALGVK